jgi:hypothetical protein
MVGVEVSHPMFDADLSQRNDLEATREPGPASTSSNLGLTHPTPDECIQIWTNTSLSWKDSLTVPLYLAESQFLTTIPLAKDGGMTTWILVDQTLPASRRKVLSSCESFRKRSLLRSAGKVEDVIIHGIASVFCPSECRGRGYAARLMREVAQELRGWQSNHGRPIGSVLYSDIGKEYYARLGWLPNPTNSHLEFAPVKHGWPSQARAISEADLGKLCCRDENAVREALAKPEPETKTQVTILPDLEHMLWHLCKEDFATKYLFSKVPQAKGAIAGVPGKLVWAIWTRRYYNHVESAEHDNVLYILRLVIEGDATANRPNDYEQPRVTIDGAQGDSLKAVLEAAQAEAAEWRLDRVKLWEPSPLALESIEKSGLNYDVVERQEESIASAFWFDDSPPPTWINNQHYAWC